MVSPPKDLHDNKLFRAWLRRQCEVNHRRRAAVLDHCKHDLIFYADSFVWQYNPLKVGSEVGPFICRPKQEQILRRTSARFFPETPTQLRLDTIWEKSREEGASWMALFLFDHRCHFFNRQKFLWVSHSTDAVDRSADPDTLFWKVRFMHEHLPEWISGGIEAFKLRFWYPGTKSSTTGQASTERSGVGGRATAIGLDELSKQPNAREIISQTQATGPRLMISTHYQAEGNAFWEQCQRPDVAKERLHWSDNPEKNPGAYKWDVETNRVTVLHPGYPPEYTPVKSADTPGGPYAGIRSPWYDAVEAQTGSRRDMALHYDIDALSATWQFFEGPFIARLVREHARPHLWEGDIRIDPDTNRALELVREVGGPLKLWIYPDGHASVPEARYTIGADIAAGTGATPSCLGITNADLGMKVGEYSNRQISPDEFAPISAALGWLFNDGRTGAYFCWERAGAVGKRFGGEFFKTGYRNVYYQQGEQHFAGAREPTELPGWFPSKEARVELYQQYRSALAKGTFVNPSKEALEECLKFYRTVDNDVKHSGEQSDDPSAKGWSHGDQVLADALSNMIAEIIGSRRPIEETAPDLVSGGWLWRRQQAEQSDRDREMAWD